MDRDEAMRLLQSGEKGIEEWNRRRAAGEDIPSLIGADLTRADLIGADLIGADLTRADLIGADLRRADLRGAQLSRADLSRADLTGADLYRAGLSGTNLFGAVLTGAVLTGADITEAHLTRAHLTGANLSRANLSRADLTGANLTGVWCMDTIFADIDLSEVQGLDSIRHTGPSHVSTSTLIRSRGNIPGAFLRDCGLPDVWIAYLPDLIGAMEPFQFYSCFISHSSKDSGFATRLHSRMVQEKLRVWYAPEDMRGGRKSIDQIDQAIRVHDKLLLVLSKASMGSDWVKHEIVRAVEREKAEGCQVLFPISLVGFKAIREWTVFDSDLGRDLAKVVREYHVPDFSKWKGHDAFEMAFARLLEDLKAQGSTTPDGAAKRTS